MVRTNITVPIKYDNGLLAEIISEELGFPRDEITSVKIRRRALDLTDKSAPVYKMTVAFSAPPEREAGLLKMKKRVTPDPVLSFSLPKRALGYTPLVVGKK